MNHGAAEVQIQEIKKEKIWTRDFILILMANFFIFLGFQISLPTLPLYIEHLGGGEQLIGLFVGVFTFSALIIRPFAGHALETMGRGVVYIVGLIIFAISMASYSIFASLLFLFAMRFIQGFGWGLSTTATGTIAADLIPAKRRGEGLGYFGLSGNLALAFGPSLGLLLVDRISFDLLFLLCAALGFGAFALSLLIKYKKVEKIEKRATGFRFDIYEKSAVTPSILLFFITFTFGGIAAFLPIYTYQKGIEGIGLYFLLYAIALMITRTFAGQLYDKKGHIAIFLPGTAMILIAMIFLAILPNSFLLYAAACLYGLGFGMIQPGLQAWAINSSPKNRRGMATATFFSFFDLGIGIGAIIFGQIAFLFGYESIYIASAISVFISMGYYCLILLKERKRQAY